MKGGSVSGRRYVWVRIAAYVNDREVYGSKREIATMLRKLSESLVTACSCDSYGLRYVNGRAVQQHD
jgi:hypothetical protein